MLHTHFGGAEWSMLKDRHALAADVRLHAIRNAPLTMGKPLEVRVPMRSRHYRSVQMHWRDTSLLAPASKRTLAALGTFCGINKVQLPPGMITRMHDLRAQDPRLFAKYAITDCRVTMTYFCKYVNQYAALFPGVERVPYTITGASIAGYLQFLKDDGTMSREQVFGLRPSLRKQSKPSRRYLDQRAFTESFARDCYHGAANFAAVHGHRNCTTWDIDIKSAYPAAACTIPAIDWHGAGIDDPDYELRFDGVPSHLRRGGIRVSR